MDQTSIPALTTWRLNTPGGKLWVESSSYPDDTLAEKAASHVMRSTVFDLAQFTGRRPEEIIPQLMGPDSDSIQGACDEYHVAHNRLIQRAQKYLDQPKTKLNQILDYYGKTGEFTCKIAKAMKCTVTYVDQQPWLEYAKYRFRMRGVKASVRIAEATPIEPRPFLEDRKFGMICSLDIPFEPDSSWLDWCSKLLYPHGFLTSRHRIPWKPVAEIKPHWLLYQKPASA